jgi:hypothetical protein
MTSVTPIGDYLARRYPPNAGATHAMGNDANPLGCLDWHSTCLYSAAWGEALRSFAKILDDYADAAPQAAENIGSRSPATGAFIAAVVNPSMVVVFEQLAVLARKKAEESP